MSSDVANESGDTYAAPSVGAGSLRRTKPRPEGGGRYVAGSSAEFPPGSVTLLPVGKFGVGLYNINGKFHALTNYCVHRGGPVCTGPTVSRFTAEKPYEVVVDRPGEFIRCPWHGWDYEIESGEAVAADRRIRTYRVVV